ncbi:MAG: retropepsin-like aspartic protease [Nitrospinota bacterium]
MPCISVQFNPAIGPVLQVGICAPGSLKKTSAAEQAKALGCGLLVDTGASITCISPGVVNQLGLRPIGKRQVGVASGSAALNTYVVDLVIPFGDPGSPRAVQSLVLDNWTVMEYRGSTANYQGLLGMDIIRRGYLTIAGWANTFIFCI